MSNPAAHETASTSPKTDADPSCESRLAAEAVRMAKIELQKAQAAYDKARRQATERMKSIRETNIGDVIDKTFDAVKRHPGAGVTLAALLGFYLGQFFGRKK
jgi:ElaB/YqjD/DUF883 family membrane-anchored ribosome-binding protein